MKKKAILFFLSTTLFFGTLFIQDVHSKHYSEDEKLILVGIGAFNDGLYDIAEKHFLRFIRDYPKHEKVYDIYYLLGKTLLFNKKLKEAKSIFLKIINESKHFEYMDYSLFWVAEVEIKLGNPEGAKKFLLSIIKKFPKFEWIDYSYYLLGLLDIETNRLSYAESSFKKVSVLSKKEELIRSSLFWLGVLSSKQEDYETATHYFEQVWKAPQYVPQEYLKHALFWLGEGQVKLSKFNEAKNNYNTFYEQFKNDSLIPEVYWRLGFCDYRLGNIKDSIATFQSFKNQFKNSKFILNTHYLLGEMFLVNGDYPSSIKELNYIFNQPQANRFWGVALINLYWNYIHLGEIEEANKIFQRVLKLNHFEDEKVMMQWLNGELIFSEGRISDSLPYFFNIVNTRFRERALFQIGRGYFFENQFRDAITNLDILLLEFPNSHYSDEVLFMKGECLLQLGNLDQALETYDLIVKLKRNNLWQLLTLTQVGSIYLTRDETEKAEQVFKNIMDSFPNHLLFYHAAYQMGNLQFKKKNILDALHYYSLVLKGNIQELFGEAYFRLGEIFYQQGEYKKAFINFETAVGYLKETSLWFSLTQLEIGNLQRRWGKYKEAKRSYQTILDHSKDEDIKKAVVELINHIESN
jgi:TolA-binding protein